MIDRPPLIAPRDSTGADISAPAELTTVNGITSIGASLSGTALILPDGLTEEEWQMVGEGIGQFEQSTRWCAKRVTVANFPMLKRTGSRNVFQCLQDDQRKETKPPRRGLPKD
jgi:hypothetical protein